MANAPDIGRRRVRELTERDEGSFIVDVDGLGMPDTSSLEVRDARPRRVAG